MSEFPAKAKCVVIGAGIVGNCLVGHLARLGWTDIVQIDKGPLPNPGGSTGHASNFIFPTDHNKEMAFLTVDSQNQYIEYGVNNTCGGIEVAREPDRLEEFNRRYPQVSRDVLQAACALGLEALIATTPLEPVIEQASLLPRTDKGGTILNGEELSASLVVGRKVRCPACRTLVFKSWPEGWDAHAAQRCRGLAGTDAAARKAEFKRRYQHLFR